MNFKLVLTAGVLSIAASNAFAANEPVRIPTPDSMTAANQQQSFEAPRAVAQADIPAMPPQATPPAAPQMPAPVVTTPAPEMPVATPTIPAEVVPQPTDVAPAPVVEVTPTPVVTEVSEALDATFVDKLSAAVNTKKFDEVFHFFAKDGFVLITPNGEAITSEAAFKTMFESMHSENGTMKGANIAYSADSVTNLSPVLGFITTKEVITFADAPEKKMEGMKSMLLKKEGADWKIMAVHASSKDFVQMMLPKQECPKPQELSLMQKMQMPIVAFVAGFIIAFGISRRKKEAQ